MQSITIDENSYRDVINAFQEIKNIERVQYDKMLEVCRARFPMIEDEYLYFIIDHFKQTDSIDIKAFYALDKLSKVRCDQPYKVVALMRSESNELSEEQIEKIIGEL